MGSDQQGEDGQEMDHQQQMETTQVPDLALTLQAMSLTEPGLCTLQSTHVVQEQNLDFAYCLLMKIACTGGTPRNISQQTVEQSMARAWRRNFFAISQVSNTIFMAHFRTQEEMFWVFTRQPWAISSDNLLLEWFDSSYDANSSSDYSFDTIYVTIRAYGIPRIRRSTGLLTDILNQVGSVSEFHIMQESNLFARQDYIWGTAKKSILLSKIE
jgi:hypothetical protein